MAHLKVIFPYFRLTSCTGPARSWTRGVTYLYDVTRYLKTRDVRNRLTYMRDSAIGRIRPLQRSPWSAHLGLLWLPDDVTFRRLYNVLACSDDIDIFGLREVWV